MIRNKVREFREMHGYTQPQLAEKSGVGLQTIVNLETVEGYAPRMDTAERICRAFNSIPIERMFWIDYADTREAVPA